MRRAAAVAAFGLLGHGAGLACPCSGAVAAQVMQRDSAPDRTWVRPLASVVLPGSGQLLAGQDRGAAYVAAELWVMLRYLQFDRDGDRAAEEFRRLAFDVARTEFTQVRRDTVFEYYEQMQRFRDSGEFDGDPGSPFAPEADPTTYNGSVWLLARRTYWADPEKPPDPTSLEYQLALEFYRARAVTPAFRWSWRNAALEHQVFRETIQRSDQALRKAHVQLGLLLANHLVSAVDALISARLAATTGRATRLRTALGPDGRAALRVSVAF